MDPETLLARWPYFASGISAVFFYWLRANSHGQRVFDTPKALSCWTASAAPCGCVRPTKISFDLLRCLFSGQIKQRASDSPLRIRFTSVTDGENARCHAKTRGARSKVQFKATGDLQSLPEGSEVLYRYQERKDGRRSWELMSAKTPA